MIPKGPPPSLSEPNKWSKDFNDFVAKCLTKDPSARYTAKDLLKHPFIKKVKVPRDTAILGRLVDETMTAIAAAGSREAALGLDEESEESDDDDEDEDSTAYEEVHT
jgi:serine/threonine protein kinase